MEQSDKKAFRWGEIRHEEYARLQELLDNNVIRKDYLNEKFVEALSKRYDTLDERDRRAMLLQATTSLLLAIALFSVNVPVSIFGMSASNASNLREIVLVIQASIPLFNLLGNIEKSRISDVIRLWVRKAAKGDTALERTLHLQYGVGASDALKALEHFPMTGLKMSRGQKIATGFYLIGGISWFLLTVLLILGLEVVGVISILRHPSVSVGFSVLVAAYVLGANAANFGMKAVTGVSSNVRIPGGH